MIKKMLNTIIAKNKVEDMEDLSDIFEELFSNVKHRDDRTYKDIKYRLHKMAYGEHLTKEMAEHWVASMENKDGTIGAHWSFEQTSQYATSYDKNDWYAVMNMMYSDYYNQTFDTTNYIKMAKDWMDDKDVREGKTLRYYLFVVK